MNANEFMTEECRAIKKMSIIAVKKLLLLFYVMYIHERANVGNKIYTYSNILRYFAADEKPLPI